MYRSFYGIEKKPFQISSDPSFMWLGEKHKEALATLRYGILDNKGFLLLTGDVGTGKTTLINALMENLSEDVICTTVPDPQLDKLDFFNYIGAGFGIDKEFSSKGVFLAHFREFLINSQKDGKKVLLIIDESQLLTQDLLEEIRLLSNIEQTSTKLINIFFIGQNEFNDILNLEQNRAVRQRLTLNYNIDPLSHEETCEYIKHRLSVAGTTETIFDPGALHEVYIYSGGFPRRINVICDHCLLSGYVKEKKIIDAGIVEECAKELLIPDNVGKRPVDGLNLQHDDAVRAMQQPPRYPDPPPPPPQPVAPQPQPVYQPQYPPPMMEPKRGNIANILFGIVIGIAFLIFAWFFMFPDQFYTTVQQIRDRFSNNVTVIKQTVPPRETPSVAPETNQKIETASMVPENKAEIKKTDSVNNETQAPKKDPDPEPQVLHSIPEKKTSQNAVLTPSIDNSGTVNPQKTDQKPEEKITSTPAVTPAEPVVDEGFEKKTEKIIPPLPDETIIVRFKYNTNDFTQTGLDRLARFSDILVHYPDTRLQVTGYTDAAGTTTYNRKLSEFRANIVRSFLLGKGINADQIQVQGRGSDNPIENNDSAWGRMMNRRVEIHIQK